MAETFTSPEELFSLIEEQRKKKGLSQRDLSKRAGLSHATFWFAATRGADITLNSALRYVDVLDLKLQVSKKKGSR